MKKFIYILFCFCLLSMTNTDKVESKSNKILAKTFKEIVIEKNALSIPIKNKDEKWHEVSNKATNERLGFVETTSAVGRFDKFDFMVLFNPDKSINKVNVLIYREDHGGEIASPRWLRQFEGKTIKDVSNISRDINGISGATMSCNAITKGIKQSLITIQKVK